MLVLTRKQQQQIQVGEGVTITILRIKGGSVRIGIEAPSDVRIIRSELSPHDTEETPEDTTPAELASTLEETSLEADDEGCEGYKIVSFRVMGDSPEASSKPKTEEMATNARIQSMRDFMAVRSSHSLD